MDWKWVKSAKRPSWTYKLAQHNINKKEEKDLGVVMQNNLLPEKHIDNFFGHTFMIAFHFLDKDMMGKNITLMIRPKLEYTEVIWFLYKEKHVKAENNN